MKTTLQRISIAGKLWLMAALIFLAVAGFQAYSLYQTREEVKARFIHKYKAQLEETTGRIAVAMWLYQTDAIQAALQPLEESPQIVGLLLMDLQGQQWYGFRDQEFQAFLHPFLARNVSLEETPEYLLLRQPVVYADETLGYLAAVLNAREFSYSILIREKHRLAALGALALLIILLTVIFSRQIARPIRLAGEVLKNFDRNGDSIGVRFQVTGGGGEVAEFARTFNEFADFLDDQFRRARQFQTYYNLLFHKSPVAMLITDPLGKIEWANPAAGRLLEIPPEELPGSSLEDFIGASELTTLLQKLEKHSGDQPHKYETMILAPGEQRKFVELHISILKNRPEKSHNLVISLLDVTEQISLRQEIQQNQSRFAALNREVHEKAQTIKQMARQFQQLVQKLELLKQTGHTLTHLSDREELLRVLIVEGCKLILADDALLFRWEADRKRLTPVVSFTEQRLKRVKPIPENDGPVWQTFRNHAPHQWRTLEPWQLRELGLTATENCSVLSIPVGDPQFQYGVAVFWRELEASPFSTAEVNLIQAFMHQVVLALKRASLLQAFRDKATQPASQGGLSPEAVEREYRHRKLESLERLVGGIAHELNNILGIIKPHLELLHQDARNLPEAERRLAVIRETLERAEKITRQLALFSGYHSLKLTRVSPNRFLERLTPILHQHLKEGVHLELDLASDVPPILADPARLARALINLVVNAAEAMPEGGRITLRTRTEAYTPPASPATDGQPYVVLEVVDSGQGIAPEDLSRIFDPFFSTRKKGPATGMGLSVAYGIIRSHNGFLEVRSAPEEGSTFSIYLPPADIQTAVEEDHTIEITAGDKGGENILVIEKHSHLREALRDMLTFLGFNVYLVGSRNEALAVVTHSGDIDIAIVDLDNMGEEAVETARTIRQVARNINIVAAVSPGKWSTDLPPEAPVDALIMKPFQIDTVAETLRKVARRKVAS